MASVERLGDHSLSQLLANVTSDRLSRYSLLGATWDHPSSLAVTLSSLDDMS